MISLSAAAYLSTSRLPGRKTAVDLLQAFYAVIGGGFLFVGIVALIRIGRSLSE